MEEVLRMIDAIGSSCELVVVDANNSFVSRLLKEIIEKCKELGHKVSYVNDTERFADEEAMRLIVDTKYAIVCCQSFIGKFATCVSNQFLESQVNELEFKHVYELLFLPVINTFNDRYNLEATPTLSFDDLVQEFGRNIDGEVLDSTINLVKSPLTTLMLQSAADDDSSRRIKFYDENSHESNTSLASSFADNINNNNYNVNDTSRHNNLIPAELINNTIQQNNAMITKNVVEVKFADHITSVFRRDNENTLQLALAGMSAEFENQNYRTLFLQQREQLFPRLFELSNSNGLTAGLAIDFCIKFSVILIWYLKTMSTWVP